MASCTTDRHGSSSLPYFTLTVTEDDSYSNKVTTAKLDWSLTYTVPYSGVSSGSHGICRATINGERKDKDYTYGGKEYGTFNVNSGSVYATRTSSAQTISFSIWIDWGISWSGTTYATLEGSGSTSIKASYTISYNANGGSGAPSSQSKLNGTNITLSSTKPTRTGYTFSKWNTNSGGTGTNYDPGSEYKTNASVTLYAQWIPNTYPVTYNNNGGIGTIASQTKTYGVNLQLSSTIPSRNLYNFVKWNTNASGTGTNYLPGANYTGNAALTLYAIWEKAISPPIISNISIKRYSDSAGTILDEYNGRYAKVIFDWLCDQNGSLNPVASITINNVPLSVSGTSGTVNTVLGTTFSPDTSHNIAIVITDTNGLITTVNKSLTSSKYSIDFVKKSDGTGVAFGKVATESNRLDSAWPGYFAGLHNTRSLDDAAMDMSYADMLYAIVTLTSSDDPDEMNTPGRYFVPSELVSTFASGYKIPYSAQYAGVLVVEKVGTLYGNVVKQTYIESSNNMREWTRKISGDNIYPWQETVRMVNWDNSHQANGWNYEQYSNGTVHLWGEFDLGAAKNFSWSNITRNGTIISYFTSDFSLPVLPFDIKHANVIANFSNYSFWCSLYSQPSNNFGNTIKVRANSIVDYTNASNALVLDISVWGVHDATSGGGGGGGGGGSGGTGDYNIVSIDNGNGTQTLHITDAI